jgi:hypothetical protein
MSFGLAGEGLDQPPQLNFALPGERHRHSAGGDEAVEESGPLARAEVGGEVAAVIAAVVLACLAHVLDVYEAFPHQHAAAQGEQQRPLDLSPRGCAGLGTLEEHIAAAYDLKDDAQLLYAGPRLAHDGLEMRGIDPRLPAFGWIRSRSGWVRFRQPLPLVQRLAQQDLEAGLLEGPLQPHGDLGDPVDLFRQKLIVYRVHPFLIERRSNRGSQNASVERTKGNLRWIRAGTCSRQFAPLPSSVRQAAMAIKAYTRD